MGTKIFGRYGAETKYLLVFILSFFIFTHGATATDIYHEDFETGLGGFILDNSSGLGHGLWHRTDRAVAAENGHSAAYMLYYGLDDPCYDLIDPVRGSLAHQGYALSPVIDLTSVSAPLFLEFHYYLETENDPNYDRATLEVSTNGGPYEMLTTQSAGLIDPSGSWQKVVINNWCGWSDLDLKNNVDLNDWAIFSSLWLKKN